jgi:hypothetical protein
MSTDTKPGLERRVEFTAAWDRRDPNPAKDYGVHGVEIRFYVVGPLGAISWFLMTPWVLPAVRKWWKTLPVPERAEPTPAGLTWHERVERGEECYLVGACKPEQVGSLDTDWLYEILVAEGEAGLWRELEAAYAEKAHVLVM